MLSIRMWYYCCQSAVETKSCSTVFACPLVRLRPSVLLSACSRLTDLYEESKSCHILHRPYLASQSRKLPKTLLSYGCRCTPAQPHAAFVCWGASFSPELYNHLLTRFLELQLIQKLWFSVEEKHVLHAAALAEGLAALILSNLAALFVTWCRLCCRLQRPADNTSAPVAVRLPGRHWLNQKDPVMLMAGGFSSLTRCDMCNILDFFLTLEAYFSTERSLQKRICASAIKIAVKVVCRRITHGTPVLQIIQGTRMGFKNPRLHPFAFKWNNLHIKQMGEYVILSLKEYLM